MARGELQRHRVERIVGKRQHMGVADAGVDGQITLAGAELALGRHVRAAVHGMNF
jgi:hypothetical protein